MKVIIDISPLKTGHKTRGIGMYTRRLVETLHKVDKRNQYILTTKAKFVRNADLVHFPYFDLFFHTLPLWRKTKTVVTIHDLIPLILTKEFPVGIRGKAAFLLQRLALRNVDAVITDSENSKKDIINFLKITPEAIHVIYLAADEAFKPQPKPRLIRVKERYRLPDKYILYVGDVNPNKNLDSLIHAMKTVCTKFPDVHLVMVGRAFANTTLPQIQIIKKVIEESAMKEGVHTIANVPLDPSTTLAAIYSQASVYVQPSLYEGFGLPILEAFACEVPVVAAQAASIPEVAGEAVIYIDPKDTKSIAEGIQKALNLSPDARRTLVEKGKQQCRKFSWEKTVKQTIAVYRSVVS